MAGSKSLTKPISQASLSSQFLGLLLFLLLLHTQVQAQDISSTATKDVPSTARQFARWFSQDLAETLESATEIQLDNTTATIHASPRKILHRRALKPEPATDDELNNAAAKGCNLLYMMSANAIDAFTRMKLNPKLSTWQSSQSKWMSVGELETTGWSESESDGTDTLSAMGIDDVFSSLSVDITSKDNVLTELEQDEEGNYDGAYYIASRGTYNQFINVQAGLVLATYLHSPRYEAEQEDLEGPLTPLHQYSDVLYLEYSKLCSQADTDIKGLKYILYDTVVNEETWAIILGILQKNSPTGSSTVPYWPGVTFTMNDNEGKALLSTPLGSGLAWLLIQHKAEYGLKTAFKVQIFRSKETALNTAQDDYPSLLFWINDVDPSNSDHCDPTDACCCPNVGAQVAGG